MNQSDNTSAWQWIKDNKYRLMLTTVLVVSSFQRREARKVKEELDRVKASQVQTAPINVPGPNDWVVPPREPRYQGPPRLYGDTHGKSILDDVGRDWSGYY